MHCCVPEKVHALCSCCVAQLHQQQKNSDRVQELKGAALQHPLTPGLLYPLSCSIRNVQQPEATVSTYLYQEQHWWDSSHCGEGAWQARYAAVMLKKWKEDSPCLVFQLFSNSPVSASLPRYRHGGSQQPVPEAASLPHSKE